MKKLLALGLLLATPALAQQPQLSSEDITNSCLIETGQLRVGLGDARGQLVALRKQLDEAKAELAKLKPADQKPPEAPKN